MAEQKLGDLTVSWLTRFIRQQLETFPIQFFSQLTVDELVVEKNLTTVDQVTFAAYGIVHNVGGQGQPAFTNSWVKYGSPYSDPGFVMHPDKWVELFGVIKNGTVGSAAFTLPPGWRPAALKSLLTLSNGTTGRVDIGADGTITPLTPSSNASVVLDGLRFKAA